MPRNMVTVFFCRFHEQKKHYLIDKGNRGIQEKFRVFFDFLFYLQFFNYRTIKTNERITIR